MGKLRVFPKKVVLILTDKQKINDGCRLVNEAEKAIIEAQGNVDLGKFQHAQYVVLQAKQFLNEQLQSTESQNTQLLRMKELIRQFEETLHALETIE